MEKRRTESKVAITEKEKLCHQKKIPSFLKMMKELQLVTEELESSQSNRNKSDIESENGDDFDSSDEISRFSEVFGDENVIKYSIS